MKHLALIAAAGSLAAFSAPAQAADSPAAPASVFGGVHGNALPFAPVADYGRDDDDDDDWRDRRDRRRYRELNRNHDWDQGRGRYWQGNAGRWRCRKDDGTVGLLVGAGVGALLGSEVDRRGDRTLSTVLGAVGGGLLGREIDRGSARCR